MERKLTPDRAVSVIRVDDRGVIPEDDLRAGPVIRLNLPEIACAGDDAAAARWEPGWAMSSYTATVTTTAPAEQVMAVLTDPDRIRSWAPIPFEIDGAGDRLQAGTRTRVSGSLGGLRVGFDVDVHAADSDGLRLSADGPVHLDVSYDLRPTSSGSEVSASVSLDRSRGLTARVIGKATEALLAAGALEGAAKRIATAAEGPSLVGAAL